MWEQSFLSCVKSYNNTTKDLSQTTMKSLKKSILLKKINSFDIESQINIY